MKRLLPAAVLVWAFFSLGCASMEPKGPAHLCRLFFDGYDGEVSHYRVLTVADVFRPEGNEAAEKVRLRWLENRMEAIGYPPGSYDMTSREAILTETALLGEIHHVTYTLRADRSARRSRSSLDRFQLEDAIDLRMASAPRTDLALRSALLGTFEDCWDEESDSFSRSSPTGDGPEESVCDLIESEQWLSRHPKLLLVNLQSGYQLILGSSEPFFIPNEDEYWWKATGKGGEWIDPSTDESWLGEGSAEVDQSILRLVEILRRP